MIDDRWTYSKVNEVLNDPKHPDNERVMTVLAMNTLALMLASTKGGPKDPQDTVPAIVAACLNLLDKTSMTICPKEPVVFHD